MFTLRRFLSVACLIASVVSQSLPPKPTGITILKSRLVPGVSISFKKTSICETTPGVKAFSGFVHLPSTVISDVESTVPFNISLFFWFFEARNITPKTATAIYLNGGPGAASTGSVIEENGPCLINPDSSSTRLNPWSWNNHANLLYIDQPVQVGFSYNHLVNGTLDLVSQVFTEVKDGNFGNTGPLLLAGTLPSQNENFTANSTMNSARTLWHFSQAWFSEFSQYNTKEHKISIWATSYGGYYGPVTAAYFLRQNEKIKRGTLNQKSAIQLHLDTLGLQNGCINPTDYLSSYPQFAYNNTYKVEPLILDESAYKSILLQSKICLDQANQCHDLGKLGDPSEVGANQTVNEACINATNFCLANVLQASYGTKLSGFNLGQLNPDPDITELAATYFNQDWVQADLGVPLNYTYNSNVVLKNFLTGTGDPARRTMEDITYVVQSGVKVAIIHGDLDYKCNWLGGEVTSLKIDFADAAKFRSAGYEGIKVNESYVGGAVRQFNGLSFSRVFRAGHTAVKYQPETLYQIFTRSTLHEDVATGTKQTDGLNYSSTGPASCFDINKGEKPPPSKPPKCSLWDLQYSCTKNQKDAVTANKALVKNFIVTSPAF